MSNPELTDKLTEIIVIPGELAICVLIVLIIWIALKVMTGDKND